MNYAEQWAKTLFFVWVSLTEHKWVILPRAPRVQSTAMDSELMECQNCLRAYEVKNEQDGSVRLVAVWTGCKRTPSNAGMSDRDQRDLLRT